MSGHTGAQAAKTMLDNAGIHRRRDQAGAGNLSDHYNPMTKTLALSEAVYGTPSVAAVGVACHEAGHAIQHASELQADVGSSLLVKPANIGSSSASTLMIIGHGDRRHRSVQGRHRPFRAQPCFQLVTLPVEFDASARAKKLSSSTGSSSPRRRKESTRCSMRRR